VVFRGKNKLGAKSHSRLFRRGLPKRENGVGGKVFKRVGVSNEL